MDAVAPRPHVRNRYVFYGDLALILVSVLGSFALRLGMRDTGEHRVMALGDGNDIGNITSWATTTGSINPSLYGNWVDVATWAKTLGLTNKLYCQALRVNSLSYMTQQDVFRRPT